MNFYIVFCKQRKKFDKYIKINKVRSKVIIDIGQQLEEENLDYNKYKDYFNLIVYTRIVHSLKKGKNIYYIPDFTNKNINIKEIFKIKEILNFNIKFNILLFYDEFKEDEQILNDLLSNINLFDTSQIIKDY